jgi:hypothetical protein
VLVAHAMPAAAGQVMAIWVWEQETFRMLDEPEWRASVLGELREDGFDTLYLYADSWKGRNPIAGDPQLYAQTIEDAHAAGFRVEALLGSAYLGTNRYVMPDRRGEARAMIDRVLAYNRSQETKARFDAIHLDIEPYTLPEWKTDRDMVAGYFAEAAREWAELAKDGGPVEIGAAIPFWFEKVDREQETLATALLEAFDYVALMDYRDRAEGRDGIIAHASYEVDAAAEIGRKVIVGVETDEAELDKLTFAEEGREEMAAELEKVRQEFRGRAGYGGIAVHHLRSWLGMR